jgi:hypothetical protein
MKEKEASWFAKLQCKIRGHKWKVVKKDNNSYYNDVQEWVCTCCGEKTTIRRR